MLSAEALQRHDTLTRENYREIEKECPELKGYINGSIYQIQELEQYALLKNTYSNETEYMKYIESKEAKAKVTLLSYAYYVAYQYATKKSLKIPTQIKVDAVTEVKEPILKDFSVIETDELIKLVREIPTESLIGHNVNPYCSWLEKHKDDLARCRKTLEKNEQDTILIKQIQVTELQSINGLNKWFKDAVSLYCMWRKITTPTLGDRFVPMEVKIPSKQAEKLHLEPTNENLYLLSANQLVTLLKEIPRNFSNNFYSGLNLPTYTESLLNLSSKIELIAELLQACCDDSPYVMELQARREKLIPKYDKVVDDAVKLYCAFKEIVVPIRKKEEAKLELGDRNLYDLSCSELIRLTSQLPTDRRYGDVFGFNIPSYFTWLVHHKREYEDLELMRTKYKDKFNAEELTKQEQRIKNDYTDMFENLVICYCSFKGITAVKPPSDFTIKHEDSNRDFVTPTMNIVPKPSSSTEKFVDTEFTLENCGMTTVSSAVKWRRISEISENAQFVIDGFSIDDIQQGGLGNCAFCGAVSAICARQPTILKRIFIERDEERGKYTFRLFRVDNKLEGTPVLITIDDHLPVSEYNTMFYGKCTNKNEFWFPLLEKAVAKMLGGYNKISSSFALAVDWLSGGKCSYNYAFKFPTIDAFWKHVVSSTIFICVKLLCSINCSSEVHCLDLLLEIALLISSLDWSLFINTPFMI
jgi:hypothetical protein